MAGASFCAELLVVMVLIACSHLVSVRAQEHQHEQAHVHAPASSPTSAAAALASFATHPALGIVLALMGRILFH